MVVTTIKRFSTIPVLFGSTRRQTHGHVSPPPHHLQVAMTHFAQGSEQTLEPKQLPPTPQYLHPSPASASPSFHNITFTSSLSLSLATNFLYLFPLFYARLFLCSEPFLFLYSSTIFTPSLL
jgi:hypothetical protein